MTGLGGCPGEGGGVELRLIRTGARGGEYKIGPELNRDDVGGWSGTISEEP